MTNKDRILLAPLLLVKVLIRYESYEVKKSRYPGSYYDVHRLYLLWFVPIFHCEVKNNRYF